MRYTVCLLTTRDIRYRVHKGWRLRASCRNKTGDILYTSPPGESFNTPLTPTSIGCSICIYLGRYTEAGTTGASASPAEASPGVGRAGGGGCARGWSMYQIRIYCCVYSTRVCTWC